MSCPSVSRFALLASLFGTLSSQGIEVTLTWGVRQLDYPALSANETALYEADGTEFTVNGFNARYEMRLYDVGDGVFDSSLGFSSMRLVDAANAVDAVASFKWKKPFAVPGETVLPLTYVGDIEEIDPDGELYDDEQLFYEERWEAVHFVTLVRDKATGATYRLSETPGGTAFLTLGAFGGTIDLSGCAFNPGAQVNQWHMTVHCDSKKAYLGAPLPARCVWMADRGLTAADLEGVSDRRIARAAALGKAPDEVADVTLRIDGFDPETGTVSYGFDAEAPDGTTNAVTKLWYGAELRLLGGTELGSWTTTNVVDVATAGGRVAVPTGGDARFYRLELAVP